MPNAALRQDTLPCSWFSFPSQVIVWEACLFHVICVNSHLVTMERNWLRFQSSRWICELRVLIFVDISLLGETNSCA